MTDPASQTGASKALLASNIVYVTLSALGINVSVFVANWAVIRWYGGTFHGHLVWLVSAAGLAMLFSDLGLASGAGIRRIARLRAARSDKLAEATSAVATLPLIVAAVLAVVMIAFAGRIAAARGPITGAGSGIDVLAVRLVGAWIVLMAAVRLCRVLFVGFERMANILLTTPAAQAVKLIWVFVCAGLGLPAIWIFVGWTGAWAAAVAVSALRTRAMASALGLRLQPRVGPLGEALRTVARALPYYLPQLSILGLPFIMQLLISIWQPSIKVSTFQVCFSLALVSRLLATPISTALLPRVAHIDASPEADHEQTAGVLRQVSRLLGLVGTGVFAAYWAIGPQLLTKLYNPAYAEAAPALVILAAAVAVDNYTLQLDQVLMAMRYVGVVAWLEVLRYAVLAGVACWAIPAHAALGAAMAVLVATCVTAAVKMLAARTRLKGIAAASFACTVGTFGAVAAASFLPHGSYFLLPVWLAAALALRLLRPREIGQWARILLRSFAPAKVS